MQTACEHWGTYNRWPQRSSIVSLLTQDAKTLNFALALCTEMCGGLRGVCTFFLILLRSVRTLFLLPLLTLNPALVHLNITLFSLLILCLWNFTNGPILYSPHQSCKNYWWSCETGGYYQDFLWLHSGKDCSLGSLNYPEFPLHEQL